MVRLPRAAALLLLKGVLQEVVLLVRPESDLRPHKQGMPFMGRDSSE